MTSRNDLDFLNPHEITGEIEKSKNELFWECENNSSEAIDYVHELETQIRQAKEELKFIRETLQVSGRMDFYIKKINKVLNLMK